MRRILLGAVTVVFGGAVALGVRNAVVDGMGGEASVVEEAGRPNGAVMPGGAGRTAGAPADTAMPPSPEGEEARPAPGAVAPGSAAESAVRGRDGVGGAGASAGAAAPSEAVETRGADRARPAEGRSGTASSAPNVAGGTGGAEPAAQERSVAQEPDARTVLLRASEAYGKVRSLRAEFVQTAENPLLRSRVTSRGTLVQRRPDRFLMRFSEPAGDVIVSDGEWIWVYYPSVDEKQVMRAPVGAGGAGGADLQAQFLGDPLTRFTPTLEGTESVRGRRAYVLLLTPRVDTGFRSLKVWVDAQDHLVRRFELVESNGVKRHFELDRLEVDVAAPDSLFRFTPPEGARIVERG
jgi:outer membrane lipoprotein carrier protein